VTILQSLLVSAIVVFVEIAIKELLHRVVRTVSV
jgi:hypothetical protein